MEGEHPAPGPLHHLHVGEEEPLGELKEGVGHLQGVEVLGAQDLALGAHAQEEGAPLVVGEARGVAGQVLGGDVLGQEEGALVLPPGQAFLQLLPRHGAQFTGRPGRRGRGSVAGLFNKSVTYVPFSRNT